MIDLNKVENSKDYNDYLNSIPRETLLKILENSFTEIYVLDKDGKVVYANPAITRLYGLRPEDVVQKDSRKIKEGLWDPYSFDLTKVSRQAIVTENIYYKTNRTIICINVPVYNENDEFEYMISTSLDNIRSVDLSYRDVRNPIESIDLDFSDMVVGKNELFKQCLSDLEKISKSDCNLLILGESGTGKSYIAQTVHNESRRRHKPFLAINCAAIPDGLFESELFGYVPGAFTGANAKGKVGLLKNADGGTIFLDEIGDLSLKMQAKILDVLENQRFIPVGSDKPEHVNIRIIAATNQNLVQAIKDKTFRSDLYWRLNTAKVVLPPLRHRQDDVILLTTHFLNSFNKRQNTKKFFSESLLAAFISYDWPGNVRQLKNAVERMCILSDKTIVDKKLFLQYLDQEEDIHEVYEDCFNLEEFKKRTVIKLYSKYKSSRIIAKKMGVSQSTANSLINKYIKNTDEDDE
ncbi:sigma-54 interaction domain-containing protein [Alkalibacter mobilis]|uniref:sigma-54 interaction domain-containing protein n=1 Tax=Alkalibacter mobilis TaxID=2787712 RepID=UPI00189CD0DB|nr:sigma 54-interacting transcriptional regulator [Alkalibacter mobilis]MBF7095685.1 sigma 54-interacting transcriptional regulator [Alkalibacter mobilis]